VSIDFLYRHRELRARIAELRAAPATDLTDRPATSDGTVTHALKLQVRQLRGEKADLE
jgi:hypothetical protein